MNSLSSPCWYSPLPCRGGRFAQCTCRLFPPVTSCALCSMFQAWRSAPSSAGSCAAWPGGGRSPGQRSRCSTTWASAGPWWWPSTAWASPERPGEAARGAAALGRGWTGPVRSTHPQGTAWGQLRGLPSAPGRAAEGSALCTEGAYKRVSFSSHLWRAQNALLCGNAPPALAHGPWL